MAIFFRFNKALIMHVSDTSVPWFKKKPMFSVKNKFYEIICMLEQQQIYTVVYFFVKSISILLIPYFK